MEASHASLVGTWRLSGCLIRLSGCLIREKTLVQINSRIRLVRLRPEFADLYPGLDPGVWETATELAARLLAQHAIQPSPGFMLSNRPLPEEHFEFQGGDPRRPSWTGVRSRSTD